MSIVEYLKYLEVYTKWLQAQGREADGSFQVHDDAPNPPWWVGN